jgi:hypothetical protein
MISPTATPPDYNLLVFYRELKKIYVILPQSPMDIPTDCNPSVQRVEKNLRDRATITDGVTDGVIDIYHRWIHRRFTHNPKRTHVRGVVDQHNYRRICRQIEKSGGIFEFFWCEYQLITDGITDGI